MQTKNLIKKAGGKKHKTVIWNGEEKFSRLFVKYFIFLPPLECLVTLVGSCID